jgi:1,4-alpha-glucan branching enzyme
VRDLNHVYRDAKALWDVDFEASGFAWLEPNDAENNVVSFLRRSESGEDVLVAACNFSPVPRHGYRMGLPRGGRWREAVNTDAEVYGGSGVGNFGGFEADGEGWHGMTASAEISVPPLGTIWLRHEG